MADQNYNEINKLLYQYKAGNDLALYELYEFYKPLFISSVKEFSIRNQDFHLTEKIF